MRASSPLLFSVSLLVSGTVIFSGCQSTKTPALAQGATASNSIQSAADTIVAARGQINVTLASLRNLTERPGDIPAQYKTVREEIAALATSSAKIGASADAMRAHGDAYLADWAKQIAQIGDADLRKAAFERRAEVATQLEAIFRGYQRVKADFAPFEANLVDIQRTLGSDLSAHGLAVVKPFVEKAVLSAEPLKASLDKLSAEFRAAGLSLQPGGGV